MIFDTFMFRDELDMLEFRLSHMENHHVRHVIVEATRTHRGEPKPLVLQENWERFKPWHNRIHLVTCDVLAPPEAESDPWRREHAQRDAARESIISQAKREDMVLISDVDEIPDMRRLIEWPTTQPAVLLQRVLAFAVDWQFADEQSTSVLCPSALLGWSPLSLIRDSRHGYAPMQHAGWHFSWLGGPEGIRNKAAAHCHAEHDQVLAEGVASGWLYEQGHSIWNDALHPVDVDESWPAWVRDRKCPEGWFRPREEAQ